jgi:hypothetical protein
MMPINILLEKVIGQKVVDIEMIGAILDGHRWAISISNGIASDCGDKWLCKMMDRESDFRFECVAPSLRTVIIKALELLKEKE